MPSYENRIVDMAPAGTNPKLSAGEMAMLHTTADHPQIHRAKRRYQLLREAIESENSPATIRAARLQLLNLDRVEELNALYSKLPTKPEHR